MSQPKKYRKKPVVIEAMQFDGSAQSAGEILDWVNSNGGQATLDRVDGAEVLVINTLEGPMSGAHGWWIIQGVQGEFYSCKPDIFEQTYDLEPEPPVQCSICQRERTSEDPDYSALQVIFGQSVGWYSGDDGEVCPEDMVKILSNQ